MDMPVPPVLSTFTDLGSMARASRATCSSRWTRAASSAGPILKGSCDIASILSAVCRNGARVRKQHHPRPQRNQAALEREPEGSASGREGRTQARPRVLFMPEERQAGKGVKTLLASHHEALADSEGFVFAVRNAMWTR